MMKNVSKLLLIEFSPIQDQLTTKPRSFRYFWTNIQFHPELRAFSFPNTSSLE